MSHEIGSDYGMNRDTECIRDIGGNVYLQQVPQNDVLLGSDNGVSLVS